MILERFIIKRYLSFLFVIFFGLTGLYLLIDAFETLPDFLSKDISFLTMIMYFLVLCPKIIFQLSPLVILLSGLLTIVTLGKSKQILAMRSIGITPQRIFRPIIISALLLAALFTLMKIFIVPRAQNTANFILSMELGKGKKTRLLLSEGRLFYRGKASILSAELILPDATELSKIEWLFFNNSYLLKKAIFASSALFRDKKWHFKKGILYKDNKSIFFDQLEMSLSITPKELVAIETPVEEASVIQLYEVIKRLKEIGLPYFKQETVLLSSIFYPFLGVSLLYLCLPIAFYRIQAGAAFGLVLGTILAFGVWAFWNMLISMGKAGTIPPVIAVIMPHIILITLGVVYRIKVKF